MDNAISRVKEAYLSGSLKWIKGAAYNTPGWVPTNWLSKKTVPARHLIKGACLSGAWYLEGIREEETRQYIAGRALDLFNEPVEVNLPRFNDDSGTTFSDILTFLDVCELIMEGTYA